MVNPAPSNRLLNNASRTVAQTAAQATNQVASSEGFVDSAPIDDVAMYNDTAVMLTWRLSQPLSYLSDKLSDR
jgi:hypothetical protein